MTKSKTFVCCIIGLILVSMAIFAGLIINQGTWFPKKAIADEISTEPVDPIQQREELMLERIALTAQVEATFQQYGDLLSDEERAILNTYCEEIKEADSIEVLATYPDKIKAVAGEASSIPDMNTTGWTTEKIQFVQEWGRKNNAYLAGTAMEGLGYIIAREAYDTNIDPAAIAAIATIESGCGAAMCGSYNAYGWISPSPYNFESWEDGIIQWHAFFSQWFAGDIPLSSMHGYGDYDVGTIAGFLEAIRNA